MMYKGTCTVMVELAGPVAFERSQVNLVPELVRAMAGYVITQCPGGADDTMDFGFSYHGLGGYVTSGMDRVYHWLADMLTINPGNAFGGKYRRLLLL